MVVCLFAFVLVWLFAVVHVFVGGPSKSGLSRLKLGFGEERGDRNRSPQPVQAAKYSRELKPLTPTYCYWY